MEFKELIKARRSVRGYAGGITHEDLAAVLRMAQQAPSWKNQQTSRCYAVETPETLEELRAAGLPSFNQKSSAGAVLVVTTFVKDVVGFNDAVAVNEAGNLWGAYDIGLNDAYLVLAASDLGYDTLIMGIRASDAIRTKLDIPENEQIMSVIAVGKRREDPALRPRKDFDEVVRFF